MFQNPAALPPPAGNTLDEAYDEGGAGAGRTIEADAGVVQINRKGLASTLLRVMEELSLDSATPAVIGVTQNDYDPGNTSFARLLASAPVSITGLAPTGGNNDGRLLLLVNAGVNTITLADQNVGSAVANRIITGIGVDLALPADAVALLAYDTVTGRWRVTAVQKLLAPRKAFQFGNTVSVPGPGTLQLEGPGGTLVGFEVLRPAVLTGASLSLNVPDASRSYTLNITQNGATVATLLIPTGTSQVRDITFSVVLSAGDIMAANLVRTSGVGPSTFNEEHLILELTE